MEEKPEIFRMHGPAFRRRERVADLMLELGEESFDDFFLRGVVIVKIAGLMPVSAAIAEAVMLGSPKRLKSWSAAWTMRLAVCRFGLCSISPAPFIHLQLVLCHG